LIVVRALSLVPAVQLGEVMVLEGGIEVFEEVLEGNDGLIGQLGEGEGIEVVPMSASP
jgi:hypothetical protein